MAYEKADIAEDHKMNNDVTKQKEKKKKNGERRKCLSNTSTCVASGPENDDAGLQCRRARFLLLSTLGQNGGCDWFQGVKVWCLV